MSESNPVITFELNLGQNVPVPVDDTLTIPGQAADAAAVGEALAGVAQTAETNLEAAVSAVNAVIDSLFPVGAIYVSTSSTAPEFYGTWVEVLIPTTWEDLNAGTRSYGAIGEETPGTLHFWRRTE